MNLLFWLFELNYSIARFTHNPRQAADTALFPFSLFLISPLVGVLLIFEIDILPFESPNANVLTLAPIVGLLIFLTYIFLVKKLDFKKRARERDGITSKYSVLRKIFNSFLMLFIAMSGIWIPITFDLLTGRLPK